MQDSTKYIWDTWELIAIKYLQNKWYKILDTNFKFWRFGEIDIIAKKDWITIFFEVKYRNNRAYWMPEEAVTPYKLRKCRKTMDYYCKKNRIDFEMIAFEVITIFKWEKSYKLKHYRNVEI